MDWFWTLVELVKDLVFANPPDPVDATVDTDRGVGRFPEEPATPAPETPDTPTPVYLPPVGVEVRPPFQEDISRNQLVIDAGRRSQSGLSILTGPGWVQRAEMGLINNDQHYITRVTENGTERCMWSPAIPKSGKYEVWVSYRASENRTTAAAFIVVDRFAKRRQVVVNQREAGAGGPRYKMIGIFGFEACKASRTPRRNYIEINNPTRSTSESVDAVLLRRVQS